MQLPQSIMLILQIPVLKKECHKFSEPGFSEWHDKQDYKLMLNKEKDLFRSFDYQFFFIMTESRSGHRK